MDHARQQSGHVASRPRTSSSPALALDDEQIGSEIGKGFAPHRCVAEFQDRRRRVGLRIHVLDGREFFVDGKRVETLRDAVALAQYITDVRVHLMQRKVHFNER